MAPSRKIASIVAGMIVGADCIDDLDLLRHGGISRVFIAVPATSTLGSFLRSFCWGDTRALESVAKTTSSPRSSWLAISATPKRFRSPTTRSPVLPSS
jgi:hypothetical protein